MASMYTNSFYLLGDDESVDVSELYDCMKKKAVLELPPSSPKARREYTVFVEEPERLEYDDELNCKPSGSNGKGNLAKNGTTNEKDNGNDCWLAVPKKTYVQQGQSNGYEQRFYRNGGQSYGGWRRGRGNYHRVQHSNGGVNGDSKLGDGERPRRNRNWNDGGNRMGRGNGGYRGRGRGGIEYRRIDNGGVKESDINGDVAGVGHSNANSEGDSGATLESSNDKEAGVKETVEEVNNDEEAGVKETVGEVNKGEEAGVKKTVEEVNGDVPEPEETPEQRKKREIAELKNKEWEEKRRKWEEEEAEEARKMTLDQYEKLVLAKKQPLNLQKEEARRVVAADKFLENMKFVGKKQDIGDILIVGKAKPKANAALDNPKKNEEKLKKSDSLDKQGHKLVAVSVAKLFERASFGGSHRAGRGQRGGNQSGFGRRFPYRGGWAGNNGAGKFPTEKDFPVLRSAAHKPETVPSATLANAPAPSGTKSSTSESIDQSAASSSRSGSVAHKPETVPSAPLANAPSSSESNLSASASTNKSAASSSRSGSRVNRGRTAYRASTHGSSTRSVPVRTDSVKAEH